MIRLISLSNYFFYFYVDFLLNTETAKHASELSRNLQVGRKSSFVKIHERYSKRQYLNPTRIVTLFKGLRILSSAHFHCRRQIK